MSDDDPYRAQDAARPPALLALARRGAAADVAALPRDAMETPFALARVAAALDVRLARFSPRARGVASAAIAAACGAGLVALFTDVWAGGMPLAVIAIGVGIAASRVIADSTPPGALAEVTRRLAADVALAFPVEGYDAWLAAVCPLLDVHLRGELDRALVADAARGLDARIAVEWRDARTFRLVTPPRRLPVGALVGDRALWARLAAELLLPIHQDVGIERVEMGGTMRELPPAAPRPERG